MHDMDSAVIEKWLHDDKVIHITYPNIAKVLVKWIQEGMPEMQPDFIKAIWSRVEVQHSKH
jgi:hypothetical protein